MSTKVMKKSKSYRKYTPEFKVEAVKLAKEIGSGEASKKLNVPPSCIDKWKSGHAMKSAMSPELKALQDENKKLKRELEQEKAINLVLKKTAAIFSRDHLE